ncbi:asparagine synthase (glutamine-hydrolyzing) [uncultured Sphingomonas sp.]|uniref:asparagine synthase (glutamine-hydrolyzing) n=1 Tax=uncultured Sphingomonas sp. TaxID=158754 RepID=UPI0025FC859F|nr:asparagine synthase (glutamine-hydrolyzing) [uncultured Sphingomonas sp.]
MCGIAGFVSRSSIDFNAAIRAMTDVISHRGPDDEGSWADVEAGVALGHRRLSILDLSPSGHQPMASQAGRYMLVYNGEIYNHRAIRQELENAGAPVNWRGHSDTEVMLAAIEHWGIQPTLQRLNGMFAFALWDRHTRELTFARDRMGEKPLYYGVQGKTLFFASELKAIVAHPHFKPEIDREALAAFMRLGYVPAPTSIWRDIRKLPPANWMTVSVDAIGRLEPQAYWEIAEVARLGTQAPRRPGEQLTDELDKLLSDAVALRMEADVPLGAFLSGGIDSSLVASLMQANASQPVRTFSIGFDDPAYNEAEHAKAVAAHLGTHHTELYVGMDKARDLLPALPEIWDEPFADSSQIPMFLVSRLAREHVTVALSGDGGDELFGGYNRHVTGADIWKRVEFLPAPLRRLAGRVLSHKATGNLAETIAGMMPGRKSMAGIAARLPKVGAVVDARSPMDFYTRLISQWQDEALVLGANIELALPHPPAFADFRDTMMYLDMTTYLPDDILVKVDRAGMGSSLEGRVPLLDHRIVEFAWQVPLEAKIHDGRGKMILREILDRYVPRTLIDRPKAGFAIPVGGWLVGPLRPWVEALIDPKRIAAEGYLDPALVSDTWRRFLAGEVRLETKLWCILMFQAWLERQTVTPRRMGGDFHGK